MADFGGGFGFDSSTTTAATWTTTSGTNADDLDEGRAMLRDCIIALGFLVVTV